MKPGTSLLVGAALAAACATASAMTPMTVDFATPTTGVTAPLLGGTTNYTLRSMRVGYTVEREPIMGYQICLPGVWCKRALGLDQLVYTTYVQAVYVADAADRPAVVAYDGWTMYFCYATSYTTASYQGFACSQLAYSTTAKPYAIRGIANGQNSYSIGFGAPVPQQVTGGLQLLIDEVNRNEAFTHNIKGFAVGAAQAAGVPMTRKGPACGPFDVDAYSASKDAHALRVVPMCAGGGTYPGEDAPGTATPFVEPPIDSPVMAGGDPTKGVLVTCTRGSEVCWPLALISVLIENGVPTKAGDGQAEGVPTPTPAQGSGPSGKPSIQDPKTDCKERAEQRKRVTDAWCADWTAKIAGVLSAARSPSESVQAPAGS